MAVLVPFVEVHRQSNQLASGQFVLFIHLECRNTKGAKPHAWTTPGIWQVILAKSCRKWKGSNMALESLLVIILVGAVAGWLAGRIVKGYGYGLLGNIVVGIVGAFVAGLIFPRLGLNIGGGIAGAIIYATIGAVILLFLIRLIKRA